MQPIVQWLEDLGLGQYGEIFSQAGIDASVLADLTEADLAQLGVLLGHRKKLLRAIAVLPPPAKEAPVLSPAEVAGIQAERRQLTVLFCDLVGSTELSRGLDPEEVRELLRRYVDAASATIVQQEGFVARVEGDAIVAYFGWPRADEDEAAHGVRAGLDLIATVRDLSSGDGKHLSCRVGIASGTVVVGDLDAAGRRHIGAVAGDAPNLAARLQTVAAAGQVVIDPLTRQLVGNAFVLDELGPKALKGFAEPVQVWQVLAERVAESRFEARQRQLAPFVGRDQELALLKERFERALAGEGQAVLLSGEAGIGKSRLVQMLWEQLSQHQNRDTSSTRVRTQCSPSHTASTLHPVLRHIERAAGFRSDDAPEVRRGRLAAFLERSSDDQTDALTALAPFFGLDDRESAFTMDFRPEHTGIGPSPAQREARAINILVHQLLRLAAGGSVLFILEDAQWIDPATRELITQVLGRISDAPVLVLITHRPEFQCDWMRHPHVTALTLNRLSRRQSAELAREAAAAALSDEILKRILHRAEGVPLFIEELTRSVMENAGQGSPVPETLQSSLLARLDRLGGEIKEIAQLAAVIGREFGAALLSAVAGKPTDELVAVLSQLVEAQILLPAGTGQGTYLFRHSLIQEAAYQSLLLSRRRVLHVEIARTIESAFPKSAESQPAILAQHYTDAAALKQAIPYWVKAGEQALSRFAFREPGAHFERALQLARDLPEGPEQVREILRLLLLLGDARLRAVEQQAALATFREAAELARSHGSPADLARAALGVEESELWIDVAAGESASLLEAALLALGENDSPTRCRVLSHLGRALFKLGAIERGSAMLREASNLARQLDDRRVLLDALNCERIAAAGQPWSKAQFPIRQGILDEMVRMAQDIGDHPDLTIGALAFAVYGFLEMGDLAASRASLARMREIVEANQFTGLGRYGMTSACAMNAILHGDFVAAERFAQDAMACAIDIHSEVASGVYGVQMFTIRREQGRLAEVAPLLRRFMDEDPEAAAWRPGFALIASDLGFEQAARKSFNDLAAGGLAFPRDGKRNVTLYYLAEVCVRLRDSDRAARLYELLLPYRDLALVVPVATACLGVTARYLGMLAALLRNWTAAEDHFQNALQLDERLEAWPWLAHTKYEFAQSLRARGEPGDQGRVETLLAEANTIAERLGMTTLQGNIRTAMN